MKKIIIFVFIFVLLLIFCTFKKSVFAYINDGPCVISNQSGTCWFEEASDIAAGGGNCPSGWHELFGTYSQSCPTNNSGGLVSYPPDSCCAQNSSSQTCAGAYPGGFCPGAGGNGISCPSGYVVASNTYQCGNVCCRPQTCADVDGRCVNGINGCPNGYTQDPNAPNLDNSCTGNTDTCCQPYSNFGTCSNFSFTTFGGWSTPPANTCNFGNISRTDTDHYNGIQPCNPTTSTRQEQGQIDNCNHAAGYTCSNNTTCTTSITVHVYKDYNHDGIVNGNDAGYQGVTVNATGQTSQTTDASGTHAFGGLATGNYTISMNVPAGYQAVGASSQQVVLDNNNGNGVVNFYLTPLYSISGTVFNDLDQSQCYNSSGQSCIGKHGLTYAAGSDTAFTSGSHITFTGNVNTNANAANGVYTSPQTLTSGTYTVTYDTGTTPLPAGYKFTTSQSYSVTVGDPAGTPSCSIGAAPDKQNTRCAAPNNGSIVQLNFGVSNESSWPQSVCNDVRVDAGYAQQIPSTANCSNTSGPYAILGNNYCPVDNSNAASNQGILFSGNTNPTTGQGNVSSGGQQVGNSSFGEIFVPHSLSTIESKYDLVLASLSNVSNTTQVIDLGSVCPSLTCDISSLATGGVYTTTHGEGNVTLYASSTLGTQNYTFVIGDDLTITSNILTSPGYSAAFIAKGDIHIAGNVGETTWTSTTPDLEGFFSTDGSFYVDRVDNNAATCNTDGTPIDEKLNIAGTVVTNAAGSGGSLVNNREGCSEDLMCPTLLFPPDVQVILHPPTPLKIPLTFWSELNP